VTLTENVLRNVSSWYFQNKQHLWRSWRLSRWRIDESAHQQCNQTVVFYQIQWQ